MTGAAPPVSEDDLSATDFALRSADALAGTLNLRRTVRCIVHLAVPHFGSWAGVTIVEGARLRRVDTRGADDFEAGARLPKLSDLGPAAEALIARPGETWCHPVPPDSGLVAALGVPDDVADALAAGAATLVTVPLPGPAGAGTLALAAPGPPDLVEVGAFAARAARALAVAHAFEERSTLARTLREALVPAPLPVIAGLELGAAYRPAQETTQIGGDFYDVTPRPDGRWALSIGDVCGKGVEAAVLTGQVRQSLRTASLVTDDPATSLQLLNETLLRTDGSTFATATFGVLAATEDGFALRLAAGGHPPPLLLRAGRVRELPTRGTLIGMLPDVAFEVVDVELAAGDVLLFYTDGAPEARGPAGVLGLSPIEAELADSAELPAQALADRLLQLVMEHLQGWPHDDIALLALRCRPAASR